MPSAPLQRCSAPGCASWASKRGRCDVHQTQRQRLYDQRRGTRQARGYGASWYTWLAECYLRGTDLDLTTETGARALLERRICQSCRSTERLHYDHILPLDEGGERLDPANVRPLCASCHARREALHHGLGRG